MQEISASKINNNYLLSTAKENTAWLLGYTDAKVIAWDAVVPISAHFYKIKIATPASPDRNDEMG